MLVVLAFLSSFLQISLLLFFLPPLCASSKWRITLASLSAPQTVSLFTPLVAKVLWTVYQTMLSSLSHCVCELSNTCLNSHWYCAFSVNVILCLAGIFWFFKPSPTVSLIYFWKYGLQIKKKPYNALWAAALMIWVLRAPGPEKSSQHGSESAFYSETTRGRLFGATLPLALLTSRALVETVLMLA